MIDVWIARSRCGGREVGRGETARAALREAKEAGWTMSARLFLLLPALVLLAGCGAVDVVRALPW